MIRTTALALACAAFALPAFAQDANAQGAGERSPWSLAIGAASDNRSKDASKSDGDPYAWAEAEWESESGYFYAGPSAETIKAGGSELELDVSGGIRPQWLGFDWDFNVARKWRVDAESGYDDKAWEFTANMERSIGPASARLQLQHTPDGTGSVEAWTWASVRLGWEFTPKLAATAEVGRREQDNSVDYTGGNIGVSYALTDVLELDMRYHATDTNVRTEQYADRLVVGISAAF